jgi:Kef-type K+ transport system membrane component KefB
MHKVLVYSALLLAGLAGSQLLPALGPEGHDLASHAVRLLTMVGLSFIMVHVGQEFEFDKSDLRRYGWDYLVAATAATFPWILVAVYFVLILAPPGSLGDFGQWKESLLQARFAAPTSAGVLFAMLAAAGLAASWVFQKARVLAIFDDLDTILLMIPLTMMLVGFRWSLLAIVGVMALLLWIAWRYLHRWRIPWTWKWVLSYSVALAAISEAIYLISGAWDPDGAIHFEVLLPAFVLGCVMARPAHGITDLDAREEQQPGPDSRREQHVAGVLSGAFMLLVGLSMPALKEAPPAGDGPALGWGAVAVHVLIVTALANLGKMVPTLCYRREATLRERLALSVCLFPRGEVGAGVLVISMGYGIGGSALTVAVLSLAVNLLLTGAFIVAVRRLIHPKKEHPRPWPHPRGRFQEEQRA